MERRITGYHRDEFDDWVGELDCGHGQHLRHKPPFFNRPWVESEEGRRSHLGLMLNCVRCDRLEFPEGLEEHRRTPSYTAATLPKGLLHEHSTAAGVWGRIRVETGTLLYQIRPPNGTVFTLQAGDEGIVVPQMCHCIRPQGPVTFHLAFYRVPAPTTQRTSPPLTQPENTSE